jgi:hypothetical protein
MTPSKHSRNLGEPTRPRPHTAVVARKSAAINAVIDDGPVETRDHDKPCDWAEEVRRTTGSGELLERITGRPLALERINLVPAPIQGWMSKEVAREAGLSPRQHIPEK